MSQAIAAVSVEITPEAQALVKELGFQAQLDAMLAKAPELYSKLVAIRVTRLEAFPETHDRPAVYLAFHLVDADPEDITDLWAYRQWLGATFPPETLESFTESSVFGPPPDGR